MASVVCVWMATQEYIVPLSLMIVLIILVKMEEHVW